jgi:hypothetical protein
MCARPRKNFVPHLIGGTLPPRFGRQYAADTTLIGRSLLSERKALATDSSLDV